MAAVDQNIPEEVAFDNMLTRFGLNVATRNAYRVVTGIRTGTDFVMQARGKKAAATLVLQVNAYNPGGNAQPQLTTMQADCIVASRHFLELQCSRGQEPFNPDEFAAGANPMVVILEWHERAQMIFSLPVGMPDITLPELKDMALFQPWLTVVTAILSEARMPDTGALLSLLIRGYDEVTADMLAAVYPTVDDNTVATTVYTYAAVINANRAFFRALSEATKSGGLHTFIDPFRRTMNGIEAFRALTNACYEPALAHVRCESAKNVCRALTWPGNRDEEWYILKHTEQHAICRSNMEDIADADKAMWFRQGITSNERYRPVVLAWPGNLTFNECCTRLREATMNDRVPNRNVADNRRVNNTNSSASGRGSGSRAQGRPSRNEPIVRGGKLPNSGVPLHNGHYKESEFELIIAKGDKPELDRFRALHPRPASDHPRRRVAPVAVAAVAVGDHRGADADDASHGDRSVLSDQSDGNNSAGIQDDDRNVGAVATLGQNHGQFNFSRTGDRYVGSARRVDQRPAWVAKLGDQPTVAAVLSKTPQLQVRQPSTHANRKGLDNRPAWVTRSEKVDSAIQAVKKGAVKWPSATVTTSARRPEVLSESSDDEDVEIMERRNAYLVATTIGANIAAAENRSIRSAARKKAEAYTSDDDTEEELEEKPAAEDTAELEEESEAEDTAGGDLVDTEPEDESPAEKRLAKYKRSCPGLLDDSSGEEDETDKVAYVAKIATQLATIEAANEAATKAAPKAAAKAATAKTKTAKSVTGPVPHGRVVNVFSYTAAKTSDIPIATVATTWEAPDGERFVLIIHEALYFGDKLGTTLLTPNQMRQNGLVIDDVPRQFDANSTHSIYDPESGARIPLVIYGQSSGFVSHKTTARDWNDCRRIVLTSNQPWSPNSSALARAEQAVAAPLPELIEPPTSIHHLSRGDLNVWEVASSQLSSVGRVGDQTDSIYGDYNSKLYKRIVATVNVATDDLEGNGLQGSADSDVYPSRKRKICQLSTEERRSVITPEILAQRFSIGLETARSTLLATTQDGIRNVYAPGERKVRQRLDHLRYQHLKLTMYSDTMNACVTAVGGHDAAQVFTNGAGYDFFIPMTGKKNAHRTLQTIAEVAGVPHVMATDGEGTLRGRKWLEECRRLGTQSKITVPHHPWRNLAEASIRELKKAVRKAMRRSGSPRKLWNLCGTWCAAIRRITAMDKLNGRTPTEAVTGTTPDISQYAQFDWYEPVRHLDSKIAFPNERKLLGRFIGVAENATEEMAFLILTRHGNIITRKSIWAITDSEKRSEGFKKELAKYDARIEKLLGNSVKFDPKIPEHVQDIRVFEGEDEDEPSEPFELKMVRPELDDLVPSEAYDHYLNAEIKKARGDELHLGTVIGRVRDQNGIPLGRYHENPLLDTREYHVRYADGSTEQLTANLINEAIMSQVDAAGKHYTIFKDIIDHRWDDTAVKLEDGFTVDSKGKRHRKITTKGWKLRVRWTDDTSEWIPLKDLKESHPLQVAEYAICNKIEEQPAFAYWVREVMRHRDRIIKKVKASVAFSKSTKFGIRVPRTVKEALEIDRMTGTTFWRDAIDKEMAVVRPAFQFDPLDRKPERHRWIPCHMIFDIKPDLTQKARFVAGGHMTDPPTESVYSSVVSRDSIRIALMYASLNDLRVLIGDIQGAYLYAKTQEFIYTTCGPEFGSDQGRPAKIVQALYGLKSSGARWREQMASTLRDLGFVSCKADADVWMRESRKPSGERYWEYVLMYVDDIMCVSHDPQSVMDHIGQVYTLKKGSVKEPDTYLGAEIGKFYFPDEPDKVRWSMSADTYLKRAVKEVESKLGEVNRKLATRVTTPMAKGYRPELDVTPELDAEQHNYYQGLIGVLRWACELGRIDILVDVTKLSHYLAAPRMGHLEQVFHIFAFIKRHGRSRLVLDDRPLIIDEAKFTKVNWASYYPDAAEPIPTNAPEALGRSVQTTCFVDADHAGCLATRRSHSGILLYVNSALVQWYSKRQNTVEASTFGSEFVAAKIAVEMVEGLRYKLRMMGIPLMGSTAMLCDNQSVVISATRPESTLSKKHNSIAYHRVREAGAAETVRMGHVKSEENRSDMLTKSLDGPKLRHNTGLVLT